MSLITDLQEKADANGDGKLSLEDLQDLKDQYGGEYQEKLDKLLAKADSSGDGKLDVSDAQGLFQSLKDSLGHMFK